MTFWYLQRVGDDTIRLLEELVTSLGQVGLTLNTSKTKILTTQAQPGSSLQTSGGVTVEVLDSRCAHKWLGCMLQAAQGGNPSADLQHRLQAASRAFHANRSILTNHQVSVKDRLTFFHAVVTPVACFAAGHRKIFKQELAALDVAHRKLLRRVVWSPCWHGLVASLARNPARLERASFNFCGPSWLETLVTHMFRTTLETWSICGEFTL